MKHKKPMVHPCQHLMLMSKTKMRKKFQLHLTKSPMKLLKKPKFHSLLLLKKSIVKSTITDTKTIKDLFRKKFMSTNITNIIIKIVNDRKIAF